MVLGSWVLEALGLEILCSGVGDPQVVPGWCPCWQLASQRQAGGVGAQGVFHLGWYRGTGVLGQAPGQWVPADTAQHLLPGEGWLGPWRLWPRCYAMLLVEQGVLWVLPMLWLVLLLSEEAGAATATTGSRLLGGPGGRGRVGGEGPSWWGGG